MHWYVTESARHSVLACSLLDHYTAAGPSVLAVGETTLAANKKSNQPRHASRYSVRGPRAISASPSARTTTVTLQFVQGP
ncbi:hypothetical protein DAEQUDRAFT_733548 [Daedalea quercina L-15889]|uniref:Uncharacterized protein n=1 Tax=Daedalea quercina L-15889 TaxID=1314783 RepID=A0A165KWU3_9APHY|nr:hypothetical protein DAEQUDRAFT_733548 [Daedalea quercina L-15889]